MSSLQELLSREGFQRRNPKLGRRRHSAAAPPSIQLCRHRGDVDVPRRNVDSRTSDWLWRQQDPSPATRSVVSILSGYLDRFPADSAFRQQIRERFSACLQPNHESSADLIANLEAVIERVERISELGDRDRRRRRSEIKDSVRILNLVASGEQIDCSVAACAQIYLAVIYKIEGDDHAAARRLLQAFSEAPALARKNLMPDLWEIFFLPHLLHLQAWYQKEMEATLAKEDEDEREERIQDLDRVYNDQIDVGTAQFAAYYKDWIKLGLTAPQPPSVELPAAATLQRTPEKSSPPLSSSSSGSNLHQAIFLRSTDRDGSEDHLLTNLAAGIADRDAATEDGASIRGIPVHSTMGIRRRENSTQTPARKSSYALRFFTCRSQDPNKSAILPSAVTKSIAPREASSNPNLSIPELNNLLSTITSSENLPQCEAAIREIAKLWINSHRDQSMESSLSTVPAIEGLLEISFCSADPQILDIIICLLAELAARNESNRRAILNADPQLEIFLKLMNIHQLFLKASILLYLLKPKAKQMLSSNWVPLVLRILELGDRKLTLFSIQCRAKSAGFYLLDQLLTGFDVDRNVENAKQVVSQGGLRLLMRRMEMGEARERKLSAALLTACVRADGSCREFLAAHLSKAAILELLLGNQLKSKGSAISLLVELMKLNRRTQITMFLNDLKNEGCLNTMHILFVYLQQASSDQRPLVAAILLQLDLLGDNLQHSIYREEGIDALVMALDCKSNKKVQENCARALSMLGGRFSSSGESLTEAEMLKRAGFDDNPGSSFCSKDFQPRDIGNLSPDEDEAATEDWQRSLALVLLSRGKKRLLGALASCMAEGIPSLSRSSLVTVAWMSFSLSSSPLCASLWSPACAVLLPQLIRSLNYDVAVEERVLACFSLLNLCRNPECRSKLTQLNEQSMASLNDLAWLTWTARELIMMGASDSMSFMKI